MRKITKKLALQCIRRGRLTPELIADEVTIIMKQADAERWLEKLEDGTQKQATNLLYNSRSGGFCCLGLEQSCNWGGKVELSRHGKVSGLPSIAYMRATGKGYFNYVGSIATAPHLRLNTVRSGAYHDGRWMTASSLNDCGTEFKEIAALIRNHIAVY